MQPCVLLACGGDVSLGRGVADPAVRAAGAHLVTFNWESPLLPPGQEHAEKALVLPDAPLGALFAALPPAAVTLANNHLFDAGVAGIAATRRRLDEAGVAHFGAGETEHDARSLRTVESGGLRIGFLGRAEDCAQLHARTFPGPSLIRCPQLLDDVRSAAARCDALVVHLHHGVEFVDWPAPHFVRLCRQLVDAGARVVVANHPHVPQGHEPRRSGRIFYCLGNLVFDVANHPYLRDGSPWTARSVLAVLPVARDAAGEPTFIPYEIDPAGRPVPLDGADATHVLDHVAAISADLADDAAMQRHWRSTALRYLGINIRWAKDGLDESGLPTEDMARDFFARLALDENRPWVRELFGDADWPRKILAPPWT